MACVKGPIGLTIANSFLFFLPDTCPQLHTRWTLVLLGAEAFGQAHPPGRRFTVIFSPNGFVFVKFYNLAITKSSWCEELPKVKGYKVCKALSWVSDSFKYTKVALRSNFLFLLTLCSFLYFFLKIWIDLPVSTSILVQTPSDLTKIKPSEMEVASQHCETVPYKTKDIVEHCKEAVSGAEHYSRHA